VVVLTTVVGTSVFAALGKEVSLGARLAVGAVSVLAAVLAALQTFLRLSERAESHKKSAAGYAAFRRDIEIAILKTKRGGAEDVDKLWEPLRHRIGELINTSPEIAFSLAPQGAYDNYEDYDAYKARMYVEGDYVEYDSKGGLSTNRVLRVWIPQPLPMG